MVTSLSLDRYDLTVLCGAGEAKVTPETARKILRNIYLHIRCLVL